MWLLDLFRKKEDNRQTDKPKEVETPPLEEQKVEVNSVLNELEKANNFGDIAKILVENDLISTPPDENHNTFGQDLGHLSKDGELPWGWLLYYKDFISQQEKKIDVKWNAVYSATTTLEKLDAYKSYFNTIDRIGRTCKKAGECHYKWFTENILGSVWYNQQVERYREFELEAPELIKRDELLLTLDSDIMNKLKECEGILQSDFIKLFDPVIKKDVSDFLYNADKYGKIKRTKSRRSYILETKK